VTEVIQAAAELQAVCQTNGWRFCFIGGLAVLRWGEPRETVDADLTLLTGFGHEQAFIDELLNHFEGRISDARAFALDRRVLLLRSRKGVGLDVALGALPFEERAVERASFFTYAPNLSLRTCSAEDLVVLKAFALVTRDKEKDAYDIVWTLQAYGEAGPVSAAAAAVQSPIIDREEVAEAMAILEERFSELDRQGPSNYARFFLGGRDDADEERTRLRRDARGAVQTFMARWKELRR